MPGIDWGAIARAASAASALPSGGLFSNLGKLNLPQSGADLSPSGSHDSSWTTTGMVPGADAGRLTGPLSLPNGMTGGEKFTWSIDDTGAHTRQITQMTLAGSLSWLRGLAVHDSQQYNEIVMGLVQAGYLSPTDARYGSYTNKVATAFLQSAVDVEQINNDQDASGQGNGGSVTTWWNHIDSLIQGRKDSGQTDPNTGLPASAGGSGGTSMPVAPTRADNYTNPEDVKAAINSAAKSVLGRNLTDAEEAQFASQFHSQEKTFNDQQWAQTMSAYNQKLSAAGPANNTTPNTAPDAVNAPSLADSAKNYMDTSPNVADDRLSSLLGSYVGILRNMTGLGSGGISSAVR